MQVANSKQEKIFIGVSWPYANGNIHLGHLAGQNIVTDVFARYHRLKGNRVLMVSGSDSHGAPVIFKAEEVGTTPAKYAEEAHQEIVKTFKKLGLLYENYTKTTTENHKTVVQNIFLALKELGYLEVKQSEQYYDSKVKRYLPDRYVRGTCPKCGAQNARGDECPECGAYLNPEDLIDPYSTLSDSKPKLKKTDHFYLNLSKLQPEISKWVKTSDEPWRKWVREFTRGWLKQGLEPRAVTRDLNFGIPVPVEGWEEKVVYVWIEAVVGYLSAAIEWAQKQGDPSLWESFWKDPSCKHYYFIAGGNVPFHTVIWPAEIVAYNQKYANSELVEKYKLPGETTTKPLNLPYDVPANKMLMYKGKKMSKGDKTGITLESVLQRYNPDLLRYFFVKYAPENHDREYIWKDFIDANNNELVANLGNFINRVLTFTNSKFDGVVPQGVLSDEVREQINTTFKKTGRNIEECKFVQSIESILELGKFANKYFNDNTPWERVKNDRLNAGNTIYNSIQIVNALRILLKPYLPFSSEKVREYLKIENEYDQNIELEEKGVVTQYINNWNFAEIVAGTQIEKTEVLFEKLEYTEELKKEDEAELIENITGAGVTQVVVGEIRKKRVHPNSEKLGVYIVNIGKKNSEVITSDLTLKKGDKVVYFPVGSKLTSEGKAIVIKSRTLLGITSEGMLASEKELGIGDNDTSIYRVLGDAKPGEAFSQIK
ncbi:MAG: Methionine-tRNA ligase [candidate division WS6 bacterium GW2011_GWF2_39_15]|uniref:Methionine--tRNA ligase n=1 Tax=candidate division WS6 bacterium GW2011_GWF2_39_15 TaxID=1619100 RepID=A0A0G0MY97_9BACT|nr:MAG: Methionine-tRNA ligase [candidate division WS6 bacterium GW2011_GWF2_39_15]